MAEEFQSRDVIRIEILGEQALQVFQELLQTVQRLEAAFQQFGLSADAVLPKIVGPLASIQESSRHTVRELRLPREQLAGLGPASAGAELISALRLATPLPQAQRPCGESPKDAHRGVL